MTTYRVVIKEDAYDDLERIGDWIYRDSPQNARQFLAMAFEAAAALEQMPHRFGALFPDRPDATQVRRAKIRRHPNHLMLFVIVESRVEVRRVLEGGRDDIAAIAVQNEG